MIKQTVTVQNKLGMHARPASMFVQTAAKYDAEITVAKESDEHPVNGKSVMGMMMLAAEYGSKIMLTADGPEEEEAMARLIELFNNKFDEE